MEEIEESEKKEEELIKQSTPGIFKVTKWNDKIEKVVRDIGNKSIKYKSLHMKISNESYNKYSLYMSSIIILTPLSGTISIISTFFELDSWIYSITSAFLSFITCVLVSMVKFGKYEQIGNAHRIATSRYISLGNNVKRQLSLYRKDRISANEYLNWLTRSFDELYVSSPLLTNLEELDKIEDEILEEKNDYNGEEKKMLKKDVSIDIDLNEEKKIDSFLSIQDLRKYDDPFMEYQLKRLNNK
jgi:hypothetical protein